MNRNVTALILIVLAIGIYATFTRGLWDDASAVKAMNDQYVSALNNASKLISTRDQVLKSYNSISADNRDRIDKMIPDTVDNIRLIIDLNSVALQHGFSLKNITAVAKSDSNNSAASSPSSSASAASIASPTLDTVSVSFGVTAPYQKFISFMQDLEASLRIMDVTHLTVSANDTGTYDFSVQISTYWLRQAHHNVMNIQALNKTWIWVTVIVIIAAIGYFYLSGSSSPSGASVLQSSGPASDAVGTQVLSLLNQIQSLNIDTTVFSDPGFMTLRDYSVDIPAVNVGRPNPFAPLSGSLQSSSSTGQ